MALEFLLTPSQGCLIGLDRMKAPADYRRFLSGHAATLVEFDRAIGHSSSPFQFALSEYEATGQASGTKI